MRFARNIWEQFENQIKSAAYTSSLSRCFESLTLKLGVAIRADDVRAVNEVLNCGEDRPILKALRDETTTLVLMVRLWNDERKALLKREREEEQQMEEIRPSAPERADAADDLFGGVL